MDKFIDAITRGDLKKVIQAHKTGVNLNPGIYESATRGHLEILKYLHENGASINTYNNTLSDSLQHPDIVKYMVQHGANVESKNLALLNAAYYGNKDMIKYLIDNGATNLYEALVKYQSRGIVDQNIIQYFKNKGAQKVFDTKTFYKYVPKMDYKAFNNLYSTNASFKALANEYSVFVVKSLLNYHKVEYKDPLNYIYVYNNVKINDYMHNGTWAYKKIFELYLNMRDLYRIPCNHITKITSVPILSNVWNIKNIRKVLYKKQELNKRKKLLKQQYIQVGSQKILYDISEINKLLQNTDKKLLKYCR